MAKRSVELQKLRYREERLICLGFYGGYPSKCACCGENESRLLTLDHINNDGKEHRKTITGTIYRWLIKNNFPQGFQVLYFSCNMGKHLNGGVCPHQRKEIERPYLKVQLPPKFWRRFKNV